MINKAIIIILILFGFILIPIFTNHSDFYINLNYEYPLDEQSQNDMAVFGVNHKFWGIFALSANIHTQIIKDSSDFLGIEELKPLDLYSGGIGMQIPLGNIYFDLGWSHFIISRGERLHDYANSYTVGGHIQLSKHFGIQAFYRKIYNTFQSKDNFTFPREMGGVGALFIF